MRSMKTLLRLLGAVSLTTVAASSVFVCCGNNDGTKLLNNKVSQNLVLTELNGNGTKEAVMYGGPTSPPWWNINNVSGIKADVLLKWIIWLKIKNLTTLL